MSDGSLCEQRDLAHGSTLPKPGATKTKSRHGMTRTGKDPLRWRGRSDTYLISRVRYKFRSMSQGWTCGQDLYHISVLLRLTSYSLYHYSSSSILTGLPSDSDLSAASMILSATRPSSPVTKGSVSFNTESMKCCSSILMPPFILP